MLKVIIAGGRDFCLVEGSHTKYDFEKVEEALKQIHSILHKHNPDVEIVDGCARGADRVGRIYSNQVLQKRTKEFPAMWDIHGKSAGHIRNAEMADYADALIAFWDGKSRGTANMIENARKRGLKIKIFYY